MLKPGASVRPTAVIEALSFQWSFSVRLVGAEAEDGRLPARSPVRAQVRDVMAGWPGSRRVAAASGAVDGPAATGFSRSGAPLLLLFPKLLQFLQINRAGVFGNRAWTDTEAL